MTKKRYAMAGGARPVETREPKTTRKPSIAFSFKHFKGTDGSAGQSLKTWADEECKLLLGLLEKMVHISKHEGSSVFQDDTFTLYGNFPTTENTDFSCPSGLESKRWGVIKKLGGQKGRVAGFLENDVFFIVYLDAEHRFWICER